MKLSEIDVYSEPSFPADILKMMIDCPNSLQCIHKRLKWNVIDQEVFVNIHLIYHPLSTQQAGV
jgi:hypothetical protein